MQLDFFTKLLHRFTGPPARPAPPPLPVAAPARPDDGADPFSAATLLAQSKALLRGLGCAALAERLVFRWNPRMRSTAGSAHWGKCLVSLNPQLRQFGAGEVDVTLRHELAHLVAQERAGRRRIAPHGAEWRRACEDLGLKNEKRCHELPLTRRQLARRYCYRCPACGAEIRRARPMRPRTACLACCRQHNRGRYDERFRFIRERDPAA